MSASSSQFTASSARPRHYGLRVPAPGPRLQLRLSGVCVIAVGEHSMTFCEIHDK